MPTENMVSAETYVRDMEEMGYVDVQFKDITESVFPGFVRFLKGRGIGWFAFGCFMEWFAWMGAQFVIVNAAKG